MIKLLIQYCTKINDALYHRNGYDYIVNFIKKSITCICSLTATFTAEVNTPDELLRLIKLLS